MTTVVVEQPANPLDGVSQTALATGLAEQAPTTENDVAIAAIEAEARVAEAAIHADARVAEAEAYENAATERAKIEGTSEWRINLLEQELAETRGKLATLEALALPAPEPTLISSEEIAAEIVEQASETLEATNSIPNSTSTETSETQTEVTEKSAEENLIPPLIEVGRKPIIRLV